MTEKRCAFCSIPEIRARLIIDNEFAWAFPTNIPITEGHTLVVPKRCVAGMAELTADEFMAIREIAEKVMRALKSSHGAEGFNCAWNEGKLAGQSVPHYHLHIVPRKEGDAGLTGYDARSHLYRTGEREPTAETELLRVRDTIAAAL